MIDRFRIRYFGIALVCALLAGVVWPWEAMRQALCGFSGLAVGAGLVELYRSRRRDAYGLDELRRVHERAELDAIEVEEPAEFDSVRCLCCGSVYNNRLPICPQCGRSQ